MPKAVVMGEGSEKMLEICDFPSKTKDAGADKETVSTDSAVPKCRKGGRPKGSKNKTGKVAREAIAEAEPERFLIRIMKGQKFMRAAEEGAKRRVACYPTLAESTVAAKTLLSKIIPDLKSQELTGNDGGPLIETPADPLEVARRVAFLLHQGTRAKAGTLSDTDNG